MPFQGFHSELKTFTRIPRSFFSELLSEIDDLDELKLTLYMLMMMEEQQANIQTLFLEQLSNSSQLLEILGGQGDEKLPQILGKMIQRGTLLKIEIPNGKSKQSCFLFNTPRGRAALDAFQKGTWIPQLETGVLAEIIPDRLNIYILYEEHIGPLTPLLSDELQDAELTYPIDWIEEAFRIAVKNNVRNWAYIGAILKSWKEKGKDEREDRQSDPKDRRRYIKGKYTDFIER